MYQATARAVRELARVAPDEAAKVLRQHPALLSSWQMIAHDFQLRPRNAPIWLLNGGRGSGKTRSSAEDLLDHDEMWGSAMVAVLCSKTLKDVRKVQIEGPSGLIACAERRGGKVRYRRSSAEVDLPYGGIAHIVSSEKVDDSRGINSNYVWGDEVSSWRRGPELVSNLILGCRITPPRGQPVCVFSTTPKPNETMLMLLRDERWRKHVVVTTGTTAANADNLDPRTLELYRDLYAGTRIGQQELMGVLLQGAGTVVDIGTIDAHRVSAVPDLSDIVVSLDPAVWAKEQKSAAAADPDPAGIVVVGIDGAPKPHAYVLEAHEHVSQKVNDWARRAVDIALEWSASRVVAEVNQGGGMIIEAVQAACDEVAIERGYEVILPVVPVWAKESKLARAEPIAALCERGRVHHVGVFPQLEKELTTWLPGLRSPNLLDAWSQAITHLILAPTVGSIRGYL